MSFFLSVTIFFGRVVCENVDFKLSESIPVSLPFSIFSYFLEISSVLLTTVLFFFLSLEFLIFFLLNIILF